jgi:hypothetical protein
MVGLLRRREVNRYLRQLKAQGCTITRDPHGEFVEARDGDHIVFKALSKGPRQPWIVRFTSTARITWARADGPHAR